MYMRMRLRPGPCSGLNSKPSALPLTIAGYQGTALQRRKMEGKEEKGVLKGKKGEKGKGKPEINFC